MRQHLLLLATLTAALIVLTGCDDDDTSDDGATDAGGDAVTMSEDATADGADGETTADTDLADTPTPTPCGPELMCDPGDVCVIECLCCGIDTGNPADQRTEYRCETPAPACDASPAECVGEATGCYPSGEFVCERPCA